MQLHVYKAAERKSISWASGTSTEIFIYPSNGDFVSRDFIFRISTATVEAEESTFTFFEGITRHLMILKGNLELIHTGRYTKHLAPYEQDTFFGEWSTKSKGKVTDFNLMLKNGATGSLEAFDFDANETVQLTSNASRAFLFLAEGNISIPELTVATGDLIEFSREVLRFQSTSPCKLIQIEVNIGQV